MDGMLKAIIAIVALMLCSCAYVQTHKNIKEKGNYIDGYVLSMSNIGLYKSNGQWYLSAQRGKFKQHYPAIHDTIFLRDTMKSELQMISSPANAETTYHPISASAAGILQREDGYYQLPALADEIQRTTGEWVNVIAPAQRYEIRAEIEDDKPFYMEERRVLAKQSAMRNVLGVLDLVFVDVPATILYNISIPIMAPFVYFHEILNDD